MNRLTRMGLMLALAAVLALPAPAMATHMSQYRYTPTAHDDLGRSDEPNFAGTTSVLGVPVSEKDVDTNLDFVAEAYAPGVVGPGQTAVVAPGCTDDQGRQPSGLCGLWSAGVGNSNAGQVVPVHTLGTVGMTGSAAPGRFTPSKDTTVRFLDGRIDAGFAFFGGTGGSVYVDYNHAVLDSPVAGSLAAAGLSFPTILPGGSAVWAWYGTWQDKNGNGVIDMLEGAAPVNNACGSDGCVDPTNEFVWNGNCAPFPGDVVPTNQLFCKPDPTPMQMPVWIYPGNHHAICYALNVPESAQIFCGTTNPLFGYGDLPGRQVICFVDIVSAHSTPFVCPGELGQMENFDADQLGLGDPILDDPGVVYPDNIMNDRAGDPTITTRQFVFGSGWQTEFYDNGILLTTTMITGVSHDEVDKGLPTWFNMGRMAFTDVDVYRTWSPVAESSLQTAIPAARGGWVLVRDNTDTVARTEDSLINWRFFDPLGAPPSDFCDTSWTHICPLGPVDNVVPPGTVPDPTHGLTSGNPGNGREPNTAMDIEPGASFNVFTDSQTPGLQPGDAFELGYLNSYAGYANDYHAWLDVGAAHATLDQMAWTVGGSCIQCATGGALGLPDILGQGDLTPVGDTNAVLQPGTYLFGGSAAAWKDRVQYHDEKVLDIPANPTNTVEFKYTVGPDAEPGDVVNDTGTLQDRGYGPETCTIRGVTAERSWAECHHMVAERFDTDASRGGEAVAFQTRQAGNHWLMRVTPGALNPGPNDCWNIPIIVWRGLDRWEIGDTNAIQNFQGTCGDAAVITVDMSSTGDCCGSNDEFILPEGNHGTVVYTSISGSATYQPPTVNGVTPPLKTEFVQDVDVYQPWGGALPI